MEEVNNASFMLKMTEQEAETWKDYNSPDANGVDVPNSAESSSPSSVKGTGTVSKASSNSTAKAPSMSEAVRALHARADTVKKRNHVSTLKAPKYRCRSERTDGEKKSRFQANFN